MSYNSKRKMKKIFKHKYFQLFLGWTISFYIKLCFQTSIWLTKNSEVVEKHIKKNKRREMTTQEIKESRSLFPVEDSQFEGLIIFLNLSDRVKYALQMPTKSEMELDKEKIKTIISNL